MFLSRFGMGRGSAFPRQLLQIFLILGRQITESLDSATTFGGTTSAGTVSQSFPFRPVPQKSVKVDRELFSLPNGTCGIRSTPVVALVFILVIVDQVGFTRVGGEQIKAGEAPDVVVT